MNWFFDFVRWTHKSESRFIWFWGVLFWGGIATALALFREPPRNLSSLALLVVGLGVAGYAWGWVMWRSNAMRRARR